MHVQMHHQLRHEAFDKSAALDLLQSVKHVRLAGLRVWGLGHEGRACKTLDGYRYIRIKALNSSVLEGAGISAPG